MQTKLNSEFACRLQLWRRLRLANIDWLSVVKQLVNMIICKSTKSLSISSPSFCLSFPSLSLSAQIYLIKSKTNYNLWICLWIADYGIPGENVEEGKCTYLYASKSSKSGTFNSPHHPLRYPDNTHCRYIFRPEPGERILISFYTFFLGEKDTA